MPAAPDQSSTHCPEEMVINKKKLLNYLWSLHLKTCQRSWSPSYILNKQDLDILHMCQNCCLRSALLSRLALLQIPAFGCLLPRCLPLCLSFPLAVPALRATKVSLDPICSFLLPSHRLNPGSGSFGHGRHLKRDHVWSLLHLLPLCCQTVPVWDLQNERKMKVPLKLAQAYLRCHLSSNLHIYLPTPQHKPCRVLLAGLPLPTMNSVSSF